MRELWYILAGTAAGLLAGMGMGGGTLLIPALTLLLGVEQHGAQGVNMLAFLPAALIALWIHGRAGRIEGKACLVLILSGVGGALLGAWGAIQIETEFLKKIFGICLLAMGIVQWRRN